MHTIKSYCLLEMILFEVIKRDAHIANENKENYTLSRLKFGFPFCNKTISLQLKHFSIIPQQ